MQDWIATRLDSLPPLTRRISMYGLGVMFVAGVLTMDLRRGENTHAELFSPTLVMAVAPNVVLEQLISDSLLGRSGKLRARFAAKPLDVSYPGIAVDSKETYGIIPVSLPRAKGAAGSSSTFNFISMVPFRQKAGDRVGTYVVGYWPGELRAVINDDYENPLGFVKVTAQNEMTRVSEHFVLRDFLTHDNQRIWPRYVVLQEALLDKLELVIADLEKRGTMVHNVRVMSGFRTPYHNLYGLGGEGGARDSRHQYGDAADIIIDNDRDGRMDDLNRDRRVDARDLELVLAAVERVEKAYPELVGGLGKYHAIGPSGPFAHIDVRGYRARWNNDVRRTTVASVPATRSTFRAEQVGQATKVSRCNASPEFAALCGGE